MAAANKGNNRALPSYSARGFGSPSPSSGRHRRGSGDGGATSGEAASVDGGDGTLGFVGNDKMHIMFTCGVCDTRISKPISRTSYEKGVVLIQCPSCEKYVLQLLSAMNSPYVGRARCSPSLLGFSGAGTGAFKSAADSEVCMF